MVVIPRRPGQYQRQRFRRLILPSLILFAMGSALAIIGLRWWPLSLPALAILLIHDRLEKRHQPFNYLAGARGEEAVGRALAELEAIGYRALHDLQTPYGNIDHVVVGPNGVFAIETKHWNGVFSAKRGQLLHNGFPVAVVKQATREAMEIRRRITGSGIHEYVWALVVSTKAPVKGKSLSFQTATVIEVGDLIETIRGRRAAQLSDAEVARAVAAILRGDEPVTVRPISQDSWET